MLDNAELVLTLDVDEVKVEAEGRPEARVDVICTVEEDTLFGRLDEIELCTLDEAFIDPAVDN